MVSQEQMVTFIASGLRVEAILGEEGAIVTNGYGGWSVVTRPRREGLTQWDGQAPFEMRIGILLDGYADSRSVEQSCINLERMARQPALFKEPPIIRVQGNVPHTDLPYVINSIEWGQALRHRSGYRVRQAATVGLLRYVADDRVQLKGAAAIARSDSSTSTTATKTKSAGSHTTVAGETLLSIASAQYGDANAWREIADANGLRDPYNVPAGTTLVMP